MKRITLRTAVVGALVLALVGVTGTAIAASTGAAPSPSSFLDSLAKHLGVSREKLDDAAKAAAIDQVDAAVAAGTLTEAQAKALKERIESADTPLFGFGLRGGFGHGPGKGFGMHAGPFHHGLDAAADYLGITEDELRQRLADGKTLAEIAKAEGKSVDGLTQALLADTKERLADAVKDGKLTQSQADDLLERAKQGVDRLVEGSFQPRFGGRMWRGQSQGGSPSFAPVAPAWGAPA
jgi:hypothetical protein